MNKEILKDLLKGFPKEIGFDDYDKHVHIYVTENSGKCGICGSSWHKTTQEGLYNAAIIKCRKYIKAFLK